MKKRLERLDTPYGRAYVHHGDPLIFMPSVTTVLSLISSPYLVELEEKIGKEELAVISNKAALRGTAMHKFAENYIICLQKSGDPEKSLLYTQRKSTDELLSIMEKEYVNIGRGLFYNLYHADLFKDVKKVILKEGFLYSLNHKFAGTTDFAFLNHSNQIIIVDFKSASSIRSEEVISKYKLQGGAYSIAFEEMSNKSVERIEIWISHPDGVQIVTVEGDELKEARNGFLDYCAKYHELWDIEKIENFYAQLKTI